MRLLPKYGTRPEMILSVGVMAIWAVLSSVTVLALVHTSVVPLRWDRLALQPVRHELGYAFIASFSHSRWGSHEGPSPARVLENGRPLGLGNAPLEDIRSEGEGLYNFWHGDVYFSSSDNSDPLGNGRSYEAYGPSVISNRMAWPLYALTVVVWLLALYLRRTRIWLAALGRRAARSADRLTRSLWLIAATFLAVLILSARDSLSLPGTSVSDPNTWEYLFISVATGVGRAARDGHTITVVAIFLLLYPTFRRFDRIGNACGLGLTLALFLSPLLGLWGSGYTDGFVIGGLLPWSDASSYYWDANRLLEGSSLSDFSSRRPLFAGMLATILGLTQHNLQLGLVVIAVIVGGSCFLASREVAASHGAAPGLAILVVLFLFSREYVGKTVTENLGISLGAVAFALLWRGARHRAIGTICAGLFLLALALNARAGAFLVLPVLVLWGARRFRQDSHLSVRFLVGGSVAVLLAFALNLVLLRLIGSPDGMAFSNYSQTLYGLVSGGKGWAQVEIDHPELLGMAEPRFSQQIYRLALDAFRADPSGLVVGSLKAWVDFLDPRAWGVYSFVHVWYLSSEAVATRLLLYALSGVGLIGLFLKRRDANCSMMLAAMLGITLSVPLVPPIDSDQMRVYAATVPFAAAVPAFGLHTILRGGKERSSPWPSEQPEHSITALVFGLGLALFCLLGPVAVRAVSRPPELREVTCQAGQKPVYMRVAQGSSIQLIGNKAMPQWYPPRIRTGDFRREVARATYYPELVDELKTIGSGNTILTGLTTGNPRASAQGGLDNGAWLVADSGFMSAPLDVVGVCARSLSDSGPEAPRFYHAESAESVSAAR